jgi:hypothetical protein
MRVRGFVIFKAPEPRKENQDTAPLATLSHEDANDESGARLGVLVEDHGVGVAPLSLRLAYTTEKHFRKGELLIEWRCIHFAEEDKERARRWAWRLSAPQRPRESPDNTQAPVM